MTKQLTILLTLLGLAAGTANLSAAEAAVAVDRSQLTLGESFHVRIRVRKSAGKPLVQPPKVSGCRIESLGTSQANTGGRGASPAAKRSPGGVTNIAPLVDAIGKLESDAQKALGDQAARQGLSGGALNQEAFDMLRATRQQALEALQGPNNTEYLTTFRITPERSGVLTLPSFIIESGGRTMLTKPMEITVEVKQVAAAKPQAAEQQDATPQAAATKTNHLTLPAPYAASELLGRQTHPGASWPWLVGILAAPFVLVTGLWSWRLWRRRWIATAPERQQRQAACAARREVWRQLRTGAEPEALGSALTDYVRGRCTMPPGEVTPAEAARSLEAIGVSVELAERFATILDACSAARYSPGGVAVAQKDLVNEARELVQQLDRQGRWHMTRSLALTSLVLLLPALAWAETSPAEQALAAYQGGLELQARDPSAAREQFRLAVQGYQRLIDAGHANAPLFCNLGHASLMSGDTGRAVHYYRQAERLEPGNANVEAGLAQVGTLLGRHATPRAAWSNPVNVELWLGPWPAVILGLAAFTLGWVLVMLGWRARRRWLLIPAAPLVLVGLVLCGAVAWTGWLDDRFPAGVIAETTALRKGNGVSFRAVVDHELPAGVEFRTLVQRDEWLRVQLADGTRGWVPQGQVLLGAR